MRDIRVKLFKEARGAAMQRGESDGPRGSERQRETEEAREAREKRDPRGNETQHA
jgi:hypothetical protein